MITLSSVEQVNAPPEQIWHFLTHLHENNAYLSWHPRDHKSFKLLRGDGETVGSTFRAVEVLGGRKLSLTYRLNRTESQKYLEYGAAGWLRPLQLVIAAFALEPVCTNRTKLMAQVRIGYKLPIMDRLIRALINVPAINKHMNEEGYYINIALSK